MNFSTNLKLFMKGYSLDDIKSIGQLDGMSDELALSIADKGVTLEEIQSIKTMTDQSSVSDGQPTASQPEVTPEVVPDYKALYEAEKLKVESLQKANTDRTVGNKTNDPQPKTPYEVVEELFRTRG